MLTRHQLFTILHKPTPGTRWAAPVSYLLAALIIINCLAVSLETVRPVYERYAHLFHGLELFSFGVFLVEYLCRVWVCVEQPRFSSPVMGRLRYTLQPLALLDLIVLVTFFVPQDFRFLRIFRITRLLRVMHMNAFSRSMHAIVDAVVRRRHLLIASVALMLTAVYCTSALIYLVEHAAQPEKFSSIPETAWWAVVTLTTIGYGDIFPITPLGKGLTSLVVLFGIGVFALPTAILTAGILDAGLHDERVCPHCSKSLDS